MEQKTSLKGLIYHAVICRICNKVLSELWKVYTYFPTALQEKFWPKVICNCVMIGFIKQNFLSSVFYLKSCLCFWLQQKEVSCKENSPIENTEEYYANVIS